MVQSSVMVCTILGSRVHWATQSSRSKEITDLQHYDKLYWILDMIRKSQVPLCFWGPSRKLDSRLRMIKKYLLTTSANEKCCHIKELYEGGGRLRISLPSEVLESKCRVWAEVRMLPRCVRLEPFSIQQSLELDCNKLTTLDICRHGKKFTN